MHNQDDVFMLKTDAEEWLARIHSSVLPAGIYSEVLLEYLSERCSTGINHATWISLYDIGFPRDDFARIVEFGATVDEASKLYDKLTEMVDEDDLDTSKHERWCENRFSDYCHSLTHDGLSLDQAFELATRPAGKLYDSALGDLTSLDDEYEY